MHVDKSNGYEGVSAVFLAGRGKGGTVGTHTVREWARSLATGSSVLDLGCGSGSPVSRILVQQGLRVSGVDASPAMIAAFQRNFPGAPADCAPAEDSSFFNREYDAVIAWGLLFLLGPDQQHIVIRKVSRALKLGGEFVFTAPRQQCTWDDAMTGLPSISLGRDAYREILRAEGLTPTGEQVDEGENWYYFSSKTK